MLLYHYSSEPFLRIETKQIQGKLDKESIHQIDEARTLLSDPDVFSKHISLFFDPIPLNIGTLFENAGIENKIWKKGNILYEHIVDINSKTRFKYMIVESPPQVNFSNNNWKKNIKENDFEKYRQLNDKLKKLMLDHNLVSYDMDYNLNNLRKSCAPYLGLTQKAFVDALNNSTVKPNYYAMCVPHLFVYPEKGFLPLYRPAKKIIIK